MKGLKARVRDNLQIKIYTLFNSIKSLEKELSPSPEHKSPSAIGDSPKIEEEDLEFPTKGKGKEVSGGDQLQNSVDQRTESTGKRYLIY